MFSAIYLEQAIVQMPRVREILARYPDIPVIECDHYGEIFNRHAQNFRAQKQSPAMILAHKQGDKVLPAPGGYGFNAGGSFYFSHMLNCLYDCRYCFLQGMYNSAHNVLFVNYEEFAAEIERTLEAAAGPAVFYSGYDCDSLALEPVSGFLDFFLPLFRRLPRATLEIRTKSTQVRKLLEREPLPNCIIAMSLSSEAAGARWEHKVPSLAKRLEALARVQAAGWPVALRFEPVIAEEDALARYRALFERVFAVLDGAALHSVSLGEFRMPAAFHKRIARLYPDEPLFARDVVDSDGVLRLATGADGLLKELEAALLEYVRPRQYYRCTEMN